MSGVKAALDKAKSGIADAAANAAKPGASSSELKVVAGSIVLSALVAGLKAIAVIPGPWTVPAVILSAAVSAGAYALSRGQVKAAALAAAAAAVTALPSAVGQTSPPAMTQR